MTNRKFRLKRLARVAQERHLVAGTIMALLILLAVCVLWIRPSTSPGLASVLAQAGLPELPPSAKNVLMVEKGKNQQNTYVMFSAEADEIDDFIDSTTTKKARERPITLSSVNWVRNAYPSWWVPKECKQGRVYHLEYRNGTGTIAIDDASGTVYLYLSHTRHAWLRWWTRYLP